MKRLFCGATLIVANPQELRQPEPRFLPLRKFLPRFGSCGHRDAERWLAVPWEDLE